MLLHVLHVHTCTVHIHNISTPTHIRVPHSRMYTCTQAKAEPVRKKKPVLTEFDDMLDMLDEEDIAELASMSVSYTCTPPCYYIVRHISYSTKFLSNQIYPDWPLANFHRNIFRRSRILVSHAHFWQLHAQFVFIVVATLCSAIGFRIKVFLLRDRLCQGPSQFRSRNSAKVLNNYCFKETVKIKHLENLVLYSIKFTQMPSCILLACTYTPLYSPVFRPFTLHFITVGW